MKRKITLEQLKKLLNERREWMNAEESLLEYCEKTSKWELALRTILGYVTMDTVENVCEELDIHYNTFR